MPMLSYGRFTRSNLQHPTYQGLHELGRVIKTIFLCDLMPPPDPGQPRPGQYVDVARCLGRGQVENSYEA